LTTQTLIEVKCVVNVNTSDDVTVTRNYSTTVYTESTPNLDHRTHVRIWKLA